MLKILVVGPLPLNLGNIKGGVEAVIYNMLEGYSTINDINVKLFSLTHETNKHAKVNFSDTISIDYYPYGIKSTKLGALLIGCRFLKKVISEYKPDIIHFQGNGSQLLLSIGLNSGNLVLTPHGMLREEYKYANKCLTKGNLLLAMGIEYILLRKFHNFIFIASYARNYFLTNYKFLINDTNKYATIPNPLNKIFFSDPQYVQRIEKFIFVGAIIPRKGLDLLLSAISKVKSVSHNVRLTVVGGFYDNTYKEKIFSQIEKLGISNNIFFEGWQNQDRVIELLKKSDCFVLPSYQETLPVSIIEAMAMGKIVVSSDVGGCPEMIQNNVNGFLFKKGDLADLTNVLLNLMLNENINLISKNAYSTANASYPSDKVAERVIAFYQSVSKSKTG